MDNQKEAAAKLDLKCELLNSKTKDRHNEIIELIKQEKVDLVFITPETLFTEAVQKELKNIKLTLLVIDEAHCISDWGHDFRLEYGRLKKVLDILPSNLPIIATTATANDRVVEDLKEQLGGDVYVSRGPLTRESLCIDVLQLPDIADRYTWILKNIGKLPGSGIIYCLTRHDCEYLSSFLQQNNISALPYYSGEREEQNSEAIEKFLNNEIKAIVATIKLGMGFDKADIGFVIHFQQPSNIVSYYQQIGRAGRNIEKAYAILLTGKEDQTIIDHFINTAFPTQEECNSIINIIKDAEGATLNFILSKANYRKSRIDKALAFLANEDAIYKEKGKYYATLKEYKYNREHYKQITQVRIKEKEQMQQLINQKGCYSKFIVNCLDDKSAGDCGKCSNCLGHNLLDTTVTKEDKEPALKYLNSLYLDIQPRLKWAKTSITDMTNIEFVNQVGLCLSKYGDVGYGHIVKEDKYEKREFSEVLVRKSVSVLRDIISKNNINLITAVPSLRTNMVVNFAKKIALELELPYVDALNKTEVKQQKEMQNSSFQCYNALTSFEVKDDVKIEGNILLIDDMVDSRWTLTVCGYKLMKSGANSVTPFALADTSQRED